MKKWLFGGILFGLALTLCACQAVLPVSTEPEIIQSAPALTETTTPTIAPTTQPTIPAHASFYHPNYTCDQIWTYFEEVALHGEYSTGTGDPALIQKWQAPLRYRIYGAPTEEDIAVLEEFFSQLNAMPGFPGIFLAGEDELSNFNIRFLDETDFNSAFSSMLNGEDANGAAQFWYYNDSNEIYTANIGYRIDIDQDVRNSILLEEIVNALGLSDSILRTDSIVYQYSDENLCLSDVDWIILQLLYATDIECGMNAAQCCAAVQEMYY